MKTDELKARNLSDEQIAYIMAENGKDIAKVQLKNAELQEKLDVETKRADEAEKTLKSFDGIDVDKLNKDIEAWKIKAENAEKEYAQKIADRDFEDLVKSTIAEHKGINHKAIRALLDIDNLKASKNQKEDVTKAVQELTKADDSKMLFTSNTPKPHFTAPQGNNNGTMWTKDSIMAIKDTTQRQQLIADNLALFQ